MSVNNEQWQGESVAEYTTRLLSGSAYRRGIFGAFELLNNIRSDRYKAKSPESRLDLDQIALHAIQSITISVMFAVAAIGLWLVQIFLLSLSLPVAAEGFNIIIISKLLNSVGALITAYELIYLRWDIAHKFLKQSYNQNFQPNLLFFKNFLRASFVFLKRQNIQPEPTQNVIIFGRYDPFLGAGVQLWQWTLAIDRKLDKDPLKTSHSSDNSIEESEQSTDEALNHKPDENQPKPLPRIDIPVKEFYRKTDEEVTMLNLPSLEQLSRLFVNGFELEVDDKILTAPNISPSKFLSDEEIWALGQEGLSNRSRAYRLYRYIDADRDQVLSYFLRFYNAGSITFVESSTYVLLSIDRQRFSLAPILKDGKASRLIKMFAVALLLLFIPMPGGYVLVSMMYLFIVIVNIMSWFMNGAKQSRVVSWNEEYNYGHTQTFRESIAAQNYENYYGAQDLVMYWKSLEDAILSGIISLLKHYHVDTSQLEQTTRTIINNGVMITGNGKLSAIQVAAGLKAATMMGNTAQSQTDSTQQIKTIIGSAKSSPKRY